MFSSAALVTWLIFVGAAAEITEDRQQQQKQRRAQPWQFGETSQFDEYNNHQWPSVSPAPTMTPWPTTEDYYGDEQLQGDYYGGDQLEGYGDNPTVSPWPTPTPYPTQQGNGGTPSSAPSPWAVPSPQQNVTTPATGPGGNPGDTTPGTSANPGDTTPGTSGTPPGPPDNMPPGLSNETTLEPPPVGNETTVEPPPSGQDIVSTNYPTVSPTLAPTPDKSGGQENNNNDYYYSDDDAVPTISPAPTIGDGPDNSYNDWNNWKRTDEPTEHYVAPNDDVLDRLEDDKIQKEWEEKSNLEKAEAEWDDIRHDKNVKIVSIVFGVTGFLLLLFVAHQLIENPDGFFGKLCRCLLSCVRIICWPCRFLCCRSTRARDRRTHQLVNSEPSTYGYSHDLELT